MRIHHVLPAILVAAFCMAAAATRVVLAEGAGLPGHIFNLGHGVLPEADIGILAAVVDLVHAESAAG